MALSETKSFVRQALLSLLFNLLLPLILWPLYIVALIVLVLPCVAYRFLNRLAAKLFRPDLDGIADLSSQCLLKNDARWSPRNSGFNIILGVVVKGRLTEDIIAKLYETQLLPLKEYKTLKAYPVRFGGYFHWKPDLDFNIRNHVRGYEGRVVDGRSPVTDDALQRIYAAQMISPWKRHKSLWEVLVLNNYVPPNDEGTEEEERSVLIFRIHHVMSDGYSLFGLLAKLCTGDSTLSVAAGYKGRTWTRMIAEQAGAPYFLCRYLSVIIKQWSEFNVTKDPSGDGCSYLVTWTEGISIKDVSEVRKRFGVSFQAVIHALCSGAFYKLLKDLGHEPPDNLLSGYAGYLPGRPPGLSNHAAPTIVNLPLGGTDRILKVKKCHSEILEASGAVSPEFLVSQGKMTLYCCPPAEFFKPPKGIQREKLGLAIVACPGPRGPVFIDDKEVERFIPTVGQLNYLGDACIGTYTSLGKLILTVCAHKHFCSDPKILNKFNDFLLEEMQALLNARPLETATVIEA